MHSGIPLAFDPTEDPRDTEPIAADRAHPQFLTHRVTCRVNGLAGHKLHRLGQKMGRKNANPIAQLILESAAGCEPEDFYSLLAQIRDFVVNSERSALSRYRERRKT